MSDIKKELDDITRRIAKACNGAVSIESNGVNVNREILRILEIVSKQEDRILAMESWRSDWEEVMGHSLKDIMDESGITLGDLQELRKKGMS